MYVRVIAVSLRVEISEVASSQNTLCKEKGFPEFNGAMATIFSDLLAVFLICFKNAPYTEAVFATLSADSSRHAISQFSSVVLRSPSAAHSEIWFRIA